MYYSKIKSALTILTIGATLLVSCNKTEEKEVVVDTPIEETTPAIPEVAQQDTIKITLNSNDKMQYDLSEIDVNEGQTGSHGNGDGVSAFSRQLMGNSDVPSKRNIGGEPERTGGRFRPDFKWQGQLTACKMGVCPELISGRSGVGR